MKNMEVKNTHLSDEEKEFELMRIIERTNQVLENNGNISVKIFTDSFTLESESCLSIEYEGFEIEVNLIDTTIIIPCFKYIGSYDFDSYNPVLYFDGLSLEFDMFDEEDC